MRYVSRRTPTPWAGRAMSAVLVLVLLADAAVMLLAPQRIAAEMAATGFPMSLAPVIGAITLACAIVYAIPATRVLGAILVTGFLGGAICTHLRLGEIGSPPQLISLALGGLAWGGLYLRDKPLRMLIPVVIAED